MSRRLPGSLAALALAAPLAAQAPPPVQDVALSEEQMAAYVGTYTVQLPDRALELRVYVAGGHLMAQPSDDEPRRLMYRGEHQFQPEGELEFRLLFTVENGRAEKVAVHHGAEVMQGVRKVG